MKISSNNLYHYTSLDALKKILVQGFKISYCREVLIGPSKRFELAIPMVCFCDIPPALSIEHRNNYNSDYAIGLSREWGVKNRLNPIMYLDEGSILWEQFSNILSLIVEMREKDFNLKNNNKTSKKSIPLVAGLYYPDESIVKLEKIFFSTASRSKPLFGTRYDSYGKQICDQYKFYDEREWRYIDDSLDIFYISENDSLKKIKGMYPINDILKFDILDLRHIIVKQENEKKELKKILESSNIIGGSKYNDDFDFSQLNIDSIECTN